jgi:hypothetical protein
MTKLQALKQFSKQLKKAYMDDYDDDNGGDDYQDDGFGEFVSDLVEDYLSGGITAFESRISGLSLKQLKELAGIDWAQEEGLDANAASEIKASMQKLVSDADVKHQSAEVYINIFAGVNKMRHWTDGNEGGTESRFVSNKYMGSLLSTNADAETEAYELIDKYTKKAGIEPFETSFIRGEYGGGAGGINETHPGFAFTITNEPSKEYFEQEND